MAGGTGGSGGAAIAGARVPVLARALIARGFAPSACAAILGLLSIAAFWPGIATYDTVAQYAQVLSGEWDDWHPPAMARLWAVLSGFGPGAAPMLVVQLMLYWCGAALLAGALVRVGRRGAAWLVVAVAALPCFSGWEGVVLKDAQMTGALFAAIGVVAWWRLAGRRVPVPAAVGAALLLGYATLVRGNAVFATVPLAVLLARAPRAGWRELIAGVGGIVLMLVLMPIINHRGLGAARSGVERTEAIYDLAGIAVRVDGADTPFGPAQTRTLRERRCVRPFFWDPLGDPSRCADVTARLTTWPPGLLYEALAGAAARHPLAYAAHRVAHLNSTGRWLVPWDWPDAVPPESSEANALGLASPGRFARWWQSLAAVVALTPLAWPIVWVVLGAGTLPMLGETRAARGRDVARALIASALTLEASFAVLSIASDLRYHLWAMLAVALAWVLIWPEVGRRTIAIAAIASTLVAGAGIVARLALQPSPTTYRAMLG